MPAVCQACGDKGRVPDPRMPEDFSPYIGWTSCQACRPGTHSRVNFYVSILGAVLLVGCILHQLSQNPAYNHDSPAQVMRPAPPKGAPNGKKVPPKPQRPSPRKASPERH